LHCGRAVVLGRGRHFVSSSGPGDSALLPLQIAIYAQVAAANTGFQIFIEQMKAVCELLKRSCAI
jgi:hypothetical protein